MHDNATLLRAAWNMLSASYYLDMIKNDLNNTLRNDKNKTKIWLDDIKNKTFVHAQPVALLGVRPFPQLFITDGTFGMGPLHCGSWAAVATTAYGGKKMASAAGVGDGLMTNVVLEAVWDVFYLWLFYTPVRQSDFVDEGLGLGVLHFDQWIAYLKAERWGILAHGVNGIAPNRTRWRHGTGYLYQDLVEKPL